MIDIDGFKEYLVKNQYKISVCYKYTASLAEYSRHFDEITPENIHAFKEMLLERMEPRSVDSKFDGIRTYCKYKDIPVLIQKYSKPEQLPDKIRIPKPIDPETLFVEKCPFCGKKAIAYHIPEDLKNGGFWTTGCVKNDSCFGNYNNIRKVYVTRETALKDWNTRSGKALTPVTMGDRIRWLRMRFGMSQDELADVLQVSRQSFHRWENGTMELYASDVGRIGEYFGVSCDAVIHGTVEIEENAKLPTFFDTIGERINFLRIEHCMTNKDFSKALGVGEQAPYHWENIGIYPKVCNIIALSEYFKVSCEWLINGGKNNHYLNQKRDSKRG